MHGQDMVLFLTDDDFEELVPQRIAHYPGVVLEVLISDNGQSDSLSMVSRPADSESSEMQVVASSNMPGSMERGVIATNITGDVNSQALVRRSGGPSEMVLRGMHASGTGHPQLRSESNMPQQEQLHQLQHQIQQLQQQLEQIQHNPQLQQQMDQTQDTQKKMQGQMDEIQRNFEKMGQEMQHSQQQAQDTRQQVQQMDQTLQPIQQKQDQLLQEIHEVKHTIQVQDHSAPDQRRQEAMQAMDQFALVQYRIHYALKRSYQNPPIPRLFILLPEPTEGVDGQEGSYPLQFRLYFLCECGTHTMARNSSEPHEVHLAKYNGYKLDKQDKFIRKYGHYILPMMYMVKYGARTDELIVPPLLGLHHATVPDDGQEHFGFLKKNIGRLVDDTIAHLEKTFSAIGGGTNPAAHQRLGTKRLVQIRQYLEIEGEDEEEEYGEYENYVCFGKDWVYESNNRPREIDSGGDYVDDEGDPENKDEMVLVSIGGLSRTMTQGGCCVWVCCKHKKEYHDSTSLNLMEVINANGGEYHEWPVKVRIEIFSDALANRFYDTVAKVRQVQRGISRHSCQVLDLKLDCKDSIMEARSPTHLFIDLECFESLKIDFRRFSIQASVTRRGFKDMVVIIKRPQDIEEEDFNFILQCQPTQLEIVTSPQKKNEDLLIRFLKECPWIDKFRIECQTKRIRTTIDLVVFALCKRLYHPGEQRVVKFVDRPGRFVDPQDAITIMFSEDPSSFVMDAALPSFWQDDTEVCDLIIQYGRSINKLILPKQCLDIHAILLDRATETPLCPSIAFLECHSASLTPGGLDALERVFIRSTYPVSVRLKINGLHVNSHWRGVVLFLHRFKSRLTSLHLSGENEKKWLPNLMRVFSTRDDFPVLEELHIKSEGWPYGARLEDNDQAFSSLALGWITAMVSVPPQTQSRLKSFGIFGVSLLPQDMSALIEVIDLSTLEELHLRSSITEDQLKALVDRITDDSTPSLPLKVLEVLEVSRFTRDNATKRALRAKLRQKVPQIDIRGMDVYEYEDCGDGVFCKIYDSD
ncbi:hypothetical protein BGX34_009361 [Mortierella sp. NVP85]|nr:hypothetical protein BGX34_009361 [Mortierella sp. NVP85]